MWAMNVTYLRLLRLMRTLRLARFLKILPWSWNASRLVLELAAKSVYVIAPSIMFLLVVTYMAMLAILEAVWRHPSPDSLVHERLEDDWGSPRAGLFTLYRCISGDGFADEVARILEETSTLSFVIFKFYLSVYHFIISNIVLCTFIYSTLVFKDAYSKRDSRMHSKYKYIGMLREVFGQHAQSVSFQDFCVALGQGDRRILRFIRELAVEPHDEQLLFSLSRRTIDVELDSLTIGCIGMTQRRKWTS